MGIATYPAVPVAMAKEYAKLTIVPGEEPPGKAWDARLRSV